MTTGRILRWVPLTRPKPIRTLNAANFADTTFFNLLTRVHPTLLTGKTFTPTVGGTVTIADQNGGSPDATIVSINNLTNAGVYQGIDNVLIPN
jgi:hypothetical protein